MNYFRTVLGVLLLTFLMVLPEEGLSAGSTTAESQITKDEQKPVLMAKKRKKKKKKRKKKKSEDGEEASMEGGASGTTMHATQEGTDSPYTWKVSLLSDFQIVSTKVGESDVGSGVYTLSGQMNYIIASSIEVGGALDYNEETSKGEESESVNRSYVLTLLAGYNIGNLDTDQMVFFVNAGFGFGSATTTATAGDVEVEATASITRLTFGLGMHYFVDSNVALTGEFRYDSDSIKAEEADEPTTTTTIHIAKIGFSLFI